MVGDLGGIVVKRVFADAGVGNEVDEEGGIGRTRRTRRREKIVSFFIFFLKLIKVGPTAT